MRIVRHRDVSIDAIAADIADGNVSVKSDFIEEGLVRTLRNEALALWSDGEFDAARVGIGDSKHLAPTVRRDWIHWLDDASLTDTQLAVAARLETLRSAINLHTFMGLFEWEGHLALYPPGSFYKRHVDVFRNNRERQVTFILYLNPDWTEGDGGELRVYETGDDISSYEDVEPRGGTLVTFLSEEVHHEVLTSQTDRLTWTGWYRTRPPHRY